MMTSDITQWKRSWTVAAASALAIAAIPGVILTIQPTGTANADVCVSGGRRVQVSGCANVADAVAPYVPPPAYYASMPPLPTISGGVKLPEIAV
jgi:hypothetical protein